MTIVFNSLDLFQVLVYQDKGFPFRNTFEFRIISSSCTHIGIFAWLIIFRIPILYNDNTFAWPCYGRKYSMYKHLYLSNHGNYFQLLLNVIMLNMMMYVFVWIFSVVQSEKCYGDLR